MASSSTQATRLDKFRQLSPNERRLYIQAVLLLPVIHLGLAILGYSHLHRRMEGRIPLQSTPPPELEADALQQAQRIARIVSIAARYGLYNATCLRRSLLLWWFLRQRGIPGDICFGVRMVDRQMEAHAWVEYRGAVVNDSPNIREIFQPLKDGIPSTKHGL